MIVGMTRALLFSLGTCIVETQSVWVNLPAQNDFESLGRSDDQCPQCTSVCQVRKIPFEEPINSFFPFSYRMVKEFTFLKRDESQFKKFLEMCIVLENFVSTERNANLLVVMLQLRDSLMVMEGVEPGCLFTKFLLRYKST